MKKHLLAVLAFSLLFSCSKDEGNENRSSLEGGQVFKSQIVTVSLNDQVLSQTEYNGTLGGVTITLSKTDNNTLAFMVPSSLAEGSNDLNISSLNTTVHYTINEVVLQGSAADNIAPLITNLGLFSQMLDNSPESAAVAASLDNFSDYFINTTNDERMKMAVIYKANKALIDDILLNDYNNVNGRLSSDDIQLVAKHSLSVIAAAGGALIVLFAPEPCEKFLGATIALAGFKKAKNYRDALDTKNLETVGVVIENILGANDRGTMDSQIVFKNDVTKTLNASTQDRAVIAADGAKTQEGIVDYFKDHNRYNYYAAKVNSVIQFLNGLPLIHLSLIPLEQFPNSTAVSSTSIDEGTFANFSISIENPSLSIVSATFTSEGRISVKIKKNSEGVVLPIQTTLRYSYADYFNSFSGTLPIKVIEQEELQVGDEYAGGIVIRITAENEIDYIPGEVHGLVAAPFDQGVAEWGCYGTFLGANNYPLYYGDENTTIIVNGCQEQGIAARLCNDLVLNGYDDWYLPNTAEFSHIFDLRDTFPGLVQGGIYWMSNEAGGGLEGYACGLGGQLLGSALIEKNQMLNVRAIRKF